MLRVILRELETKGLKSLYSLVGNIFELLFVPIGEKKYIPVPRVFYYQAMQESTASSNVRRTRTSRRK